MPSTRRAQRLGGAGGRRGALSGCVSSDAAAGAAARVRPGAQVSATPAAGALLGLVLCCGLLLTWSRLPFRRRPTLDTRLAPYVGELPSRTARHAHQATSRTVSPFPTLEQLVRPYIADMAEVLERVLGGGASVRRRLEQSGSTMTLQEFRIEQVVWGTVAFGAAVGARASCWWGGGNARSPVLLLACCVAAAVGGVVLRDQRLTRAVRDREHACCPSSHHRRPVGVVGRGK